MRSDRFAGSAFPTSLIMLVLSLFFVLCLVACEKSDKTNEKNPAVASREAPSAGQSSLIGSESVPTLDALYDTVGTRAVRGDTLGLLRILVNDSLYRTVVWPVSPAYEPDREEVWKLVTSMHKANSNKGLRRLLHDIGLPESGPVLRLPLGETAVEGGILHELAKTEKTAGGLVLFASALCLQNTGCQVLSYAQGGSRGALIPEDTEE